MGGMRRPFGSFQAQVRLHDDSWVNFAHRVPEQFAYWPLRLLGYLLVLLAGILAVSLIAVRQVTRPLRTLSAAADRLGRDIQSPPLDERGPVEVAGAARAFNTMQRRLRRYIEDRSAILAAVSPAPAGGSAGQRVPSSASRASPGVSSTAESPSSRASCPPS